MAKQENLSFNGIVIEELGNSMFKVELDISSSTVLCTISGKIRKNFIKIVTGDKVIVEISPYDLSRGRIVTRLISGIQNSDNKSSINNKKSKKK